METFCTNFSKRRKRPIEIFLFDKTSIPKDYNYLSWILEVPWTTGYSFLTSGMKRVDFYKAKDDKAILYKAFEVGNKEYQKRMDSYSKKKTFGSFEFEFKRGENIYFEPNTLRYRVFDGVFKPARKYVKRLRFHPRIIRY